jgi:broad specificity phosphatase PhoE
MQSHDAVAAADPDRARAFWDRPGDVHPPGGESWNRLTARVGRATDRLLRRHPGRDIVIVAHFGAILTALQRAQGLTAAQALAHRIEPLSVTRITVAGGIWSCETVNHRP